MENNSYKKYIKYLILSLILTTIGAFVGGFLPMKLFLLYAILSFVLLIIFIFSTGNFKKNVFYIYCTCEGLMLSPIIERYTAVSLFECLLLTTFIVTIFSIIGLRAKDLGVLKGILFVCLLGILGYSILSIFMPLPSIALLIIIIFSLYVAYDINSFKIMVKTNANCLSDEEILNSVIDMYLDILNIFVHIIDLLGDCD